jgi:hypothetical protein
MPTASFDLTLTKPPLFSEAQKVDLKFKLLSVSEKTSISGYYYGFESLYFLSLPNGMIFFVLISTSSIDLERLISRAYSIKFYFCGFGLSANLFFDSLDLNSGL